MSAPGRPVLYLDIDDTLVSWAGGHPEAAPGAADFVSWALDRFEIRWLSRWCPGGEMPDSLLHDLCTMIGVDARRLHTIAACDWQAGESKLNGIAWLEHRVMDRPFLWIEDEFGVGERERRFLRRHGFGRSYLHCNVTLDAGALRRVHARLRRRAA